MGEQHRIPSSAWHEFGGLGVEIKDPNAHRLMILIIWLSMNPMMVFHGADAKNCFRVCVCVVGGVVPSIGIRPDISTTVSC